MLKSCLIFTFLLTFSTYSWSANDQEKVAAAYRNWCQTIGDADGDAAPVVQFYAPDAILLPTLSSEILTNTNHGLDSYFVKFTSNKNIKCHPDTLITRLYGDTAENAGTYMFTFTTKEGTEDTVHARFSFLYKKQGDKWLIVSHHSSKFPEEQFQG